MKNQTKILLAIAILVLIAGLAFAYANQNTISQNTDTASSTLTAAENAIASSTATTTASTSPVKAAPPVKRNPNIVTLTLISPQVKPDQTLVIFADQTETDASGKTVFEYGDAFFKVKVGDGSGLYKILASFHRVEDGNNHLNDFQSNGSTYRDETIKDLMYSFEPGEWEIKLIAEDSTKKQSKPVIFPLKVMSIKK